MGGRAPLSRDALGTGQMLLAVDVGTTNTHLGLYPREATPRWWQVPTDRDRPVAGYAELLADLLSTADARPRDLSGVAVASVVPAIRPVLRALEGTLGCPVLFAGEDLLPRMGMHYETPETLGADRLVDAYAAYAEWGGPVLVVDCGTATTLDAVSLEGDYLGGAILPGAGLAMDALYRAAPHLPRVEIERPAGVIGASSRASMQAGAYYGFVSQVEGMVRRFEAEVGPFTEVVATGSLGEIAAREIAGITRWDPFLTLNGLRRLWNEQSGSMD